MIQRRISIVSYFLTLLLCPSLQQQDNNQFSQPQNPDFVFPASPVATRELELPCFTQSQPHRRGLCKPLVRCITFYAEIAELIRQTCPLPGNQVGVCCPKKGEDEGPPSLSTGVLRPRPAPTVVVPPLKKEHLEEAVSGGLEKFRQREQLENILITNNIVVPPGTPAFHHQEFFQTTSQTLDKGSDAQRAVEATVELVNNFQLTPDEGTFGLPAFSILDTVIAGSCPEEPPCQDSKYRKIDGSCNNRRHKDWGRVNTALQRILPPFYEDGVNSPRQGIDGQPLPSPRAVSAGISGGSRNAYDNYTLLVMQWGQFLDHDLTHTPIVKGPKKSGITCCKRGDLIDETLRHPDCFPIIIPNTDVFYQNFKQRCMEFVRSLPAPRPECNFGPREQMNQITAYLDGSNVYGSSEEVSRKLREGQRGRLKVHQNNGLDLLPTKPQECADKERQRFCFQAGDVRANEQIDLTVIHTIWMREHNRIATELESLNPGWTDEIIFQEARRIVGAELQHITYNEYLPLILGNDYMEKFDLLPKDTGYTNLYDENINPSITNVFATAAYRYGHTLIPSTFQSYNQFGRVVKEVPLHEQQFAPYELYEPGGVDSFVRGLTSQPAERFDNVFSTELTNRLFQGGRVPFGLDLVALNIQRGRDHGLASYNEWRQVCGLPRARTWNDLSDVISSEVIEQFQLLYRSVDEIDLFIGGVSERPVTKALLGPTFVCLVGDQFARLRRGDRFFYEEQLGASAFTEAQVDQLRKSSLARVLCDNTEAVSHIQPLVFLQGSFVNKRVPCNSDSIPRMDLSAWKNEPVWN